MARKTTGDFLVELLANTDPTSSEQAQLLVDTNVVLEYMSFGDLFREGDKHQDPGEQVLFGERLDEVRRRRRAESAWRSPAHRYRQLRARSSILLMWMLSERRIIAAMLGKEVLDILEKVSPLPSAKTPLLADANSYAMTTAIVQAINPMLIRRGLYLGALTEVNHRARGNRADAELLRLAKRDDLPIVTNEGYTLAGLSDFKPDGSKSLRGLAHDAGVKVYSPREYLDDMRIDSARESERFIRACENAVLEEYVRVRVPHSHLDVIDHHLGRPVESKAYDAALEHMIPLYRLVLLDERDVTLGAIAPPNVPL